MATVSALTYYPIKGCAGVTVDRADVVQTGLLYDRSFIIGQADGIALTQREVARMAVIRAQVLHEGTKLALSAPGAGDIVIGVDGDGQERPVGVHKWRGSAIDQGDEAAGWLSEVLGMAVRLFRAPSELDREGIGDEPGRIHFADDAALHLISLSSLDHLNARILDKGADPVPMNRFRPNIVITGWPEPHTEDRVRRARIGNVELGYGKRNTRCVVTLVDQLAGERAGEEPLRTLADYRREPDGGVSFGMKAAVRNPGTLFVGDEVDVTEWL